MKKSYRKNPISLIALLAVLCIGYATVSYGAPSHGVKYTKHNLGTTGAAWGAQISADPSVPNPETEICIFCHTPHNAVAGKTFLWNRTNRVTTFQMYTASPTLNFSKSHGNEVGTVSKMCLSCHDGATSVNAMANPRPGGVAAFLTSGDQIGDTNNPTVLFEVDRWGTNIGQADIDLDNTDWPNPTILNLAEGGGSLLVNDHPISFIYAESTSDPTIKPADGGGASVGGLPLWYEILGGYGGYRVECVTCHDPHINYNSAPGAGGNAAYRPFLRKANYSSSLCFTCHDK